MATKMKRFIVSLPKDLEQRLDGIKRDTFYADSWAGMIRALIEKGADALEKGA